MVGVGIRRARLPHYTHTGLLATLLSHPMTHRQRRRRQVFRRPRPALALHTAPRTHHPPGNRARGRARARASRASLGSGWCRQTPRRSSRWGISPPNHKISLRRARDAPSRARARVVAHNSGPGVEPGPPSFCTCAREKKTCEFYKREAHARFSEFAICPPVFWRYRAGPRPRGQRASNRPTDESADLPLQGPGRERGAGSRSRHPSGAETHRLMPPKRARGARHDALVGRGVRAPQTALWRPRPRVN